MTRKNLTKPGKTQQNLTKPDKTWHAANCVHSLHQILQRAPFPILHWPGKTLHVANDVQLFNCTSAPFGRNWARLSVLSWVQQRLRTPLIKDPPLRSGLAVWAKYQNNAINVKVWIDSKSRATSLKQDIAVQVGNGGQRSHFRFSGLSSMPSLLTTADTLCFWNTHINLTVPYALS